MVVVATRFLSISKSRIPLIVTIIGHNVGSGGQ
jgi:hypothetical protein